MPIEFENGRLLRVVNPETEEELVIDDLCNLEFTANEIPDETTESFINRLKDVGEVSLKASLSINDFMDALAEAWRVLGDDFELGDEEEYQATDPISFDELMAIGGDEQ